MPAPKITKAAITRAIEGAKAAGFVPTAVIVNSGDGTVRLETAKPEKDVDKAGDDGQVLRPKQWSTRGSR